MFWGKCSQATKGESVLDRVTEEDDWQVFAACSCDAKIDSNV